MDFPEIYHFDKIAVDTETTGLDWMSDKIFGISVSTPDGADYYWDIRETPQTLHWLNDQLKQFRGTLINHNLKFDIHMLREAGVSSLEKRMDNFIWDCTMVRAALIDEHRHTYNLEDIAQDYLGKGKVEEIYTQLADMFGGPATRDAQIKNLQHAPSEMVAPYAKRDTRVALELWEAQQKIIDDVKMHKVCALERDVMYVVQDMERYGVRVDLDKAERTCFDLDREIERQKIELNKVAGFNVNPNPSGSIHKLFAPRQDKNGKWFACDGTSLSTTAKGKPSIDADALREMKHPAAGLILKIRKLSRCKNTFIQRYIIDSEKDGRVYPNINQCKSDSGGTVTGRLSITKPALQQMPSRDKEITGYVRPLFLPEDGHSWYRADYSQADARAFVHYTQSPPLVAAYAKDKYADFHSITAGVTGLPRSARFSGDANAKQVGLGLLFCMSEGRLAKEMGMHYTEEIVQDKYGNETDVTLLIPGEEVKDIFKKFHREIPGIKEFAKRATTVAKSRGYLISLMGRHMHFPRGQFTYRAIAYLCQSATAEFNKVKMVDTHNIIKTTDTRLLLSVHDELNFSSNDPDLMEKVEQEMEDFQSDHARLKLKVPMVAEMKSGQNWFEAK